MSWWRLGRVALRPWLVFAPLLLAAADPAPPAIESSEGQWVFSALPKSFQKNPLVNQTVLTEMTAEGRQVSAPTAESPVYYVAVPAGPHNEGQGAGDRPPSDAVLASCLQRALAVNHFLPAGPEHPPTLLIAYLWGVHNNLDQGSDEDGVGFRDVGYRNLLSRATLVGGTRFAAELKVALEAQDRERMNPGGNSDMVDPVKMFLLRDAKYRRLYEQARGECYYLVASAYDYQTAARKEGRKLLWRSKMTVDSSGVAMADTLPTLVLNSGVYLGRDMPEAATLLRRASRNTEVLIAPLEVKEYLGKSDADPEVKTASDKTKPIQPETKKP